MDVDVSINGKIERLPPCTLGDYVVEKGLAVNGLVVELNGLIIPQQQWPETKLGNGDMLELLQFVGGG